MPVKTEAEQQADRCNPICWVIVCVACYSKSWKQQNNRKDYAWLLLAHH